MTKPFKPPTIDQMIETFKKSEGINTKKRKDPNQWLIDAVKKGKDKK